jgi:hypothetical protein
MLEGAIYFIELSFVQVKGSIFLSQVGEYKGIHPYLCFHHSFAKGILLHKGLLRGV